MFRREMGVSHDHLECSVPEQLRDSAQIYPGHYESTGNSMAVAMPCISLNSCFFEGSRKPAARTLQRIPAPSGGENRNRSRRLPFPPHLFQCRQRDRVQGKGARMSVFGFGQMNLATLEAHLILMQTANCAAISKSSVVLPTCRGPVRS